MPHLLSLIFDAEEAKARPRVTFSGISSLKHCIVKKSQNNEKFHLQALFNDARFGINCTRNINAMLGIIVTLALGLICFGSSSALLPAPHLQIPYLRIEQSLNKYYGDHSTTAGHVH